MRLSPLPGCRVASRETLSGSAANFPLCTLFAQTLRSGTVIRPAPFVLALIAIFGVAVWLSDGLLGEPIKDEVHFSASAQFFRGAFDIEALRSYPEVVTPLALVTWGQLDDLTGNGLIAGRLLNVVLGFSAVCLIAFATRAPWPRGALAGIGLLLFPYTLPLSVRLYTDIFGAALGLLGVLGLLRGRIAWAGLAFVLAIATRQYLVLLPAALGAEAGLAALRGDRSRWPAVAACAAACLSLIGWFAFFGGVAPQPGIEEWLPRYPAPMTDAFSFLLHYGLYVLVGLGVWFVLVEALVFREWPGLRSLASSRTLIWALILAALFAADPPLLSAVHPGGAFGRASRLLLPSPALDWVRLFVYYILALLAVLRFERRLDGAMWLVLATAVLSMKQQIPWEKYLLPTLMALWALRAQGALAPWKIVEEADGSLRARGVGRSERLASRRGPWQGPVFVQRERGAAKQVA